MISGPLKAKPRTEAEAQYAVDHGRHRVALTEISYFLQSHGAPDRLLKVLEEVQERICDDMARRIREQ